MKPLKRGELIFYYGDGKGKSTAAFGAAIRAIGNGYNVLVVQFIKSNKASGEGRFFSSLPNLQLYVGGSGFVGIMNDRKSIEEHRKAAKSTLEFASNALKSGKFFLVILDEANCAIKLGLIGIDELIAVLDARSTSTNVIVTGCGPEEKLIEKADIVTEMKKIKHIYDQGYLARLGIDF
ncbi:MAG: cob(I)yrinic acid a,c-diamide adenosyltransferase [Nitrososphaerota archaeon]|nr:cob(I)yrinic acid a,c-diamide adenosyltransferase [Nitrososphaerota archaeon]